MQDHAYGFRDEWDWEQLTGEIHWLDWDYALSSALQIIEDNTDDSGILVWEKDSDNVEIDADRKINKFDAAKTRKTSGKKYKPLAGEYFVPNLRLIDDEKPWPDRLSWLQEKAEEAQQEFNETEIDNPYDEADEPAFVQS